MPAYNRVNPPVLREDFKKVGCGLANHKKNVGYITLFSSFTKQSCKFQLQSKLVYSHNSDNGITPKSMAFLGKLSHTASPRTPPSENYKTNYRIHDSPSMVAILNLTKQVHFIKPNFL
jgi:hypothetical protein